MAPPTPAVPVGGPVDVLVSTFNSARDLDECLREARRLLPVHRLIVVDHRSTDGTRAIAERWGAEVHEETVGLGFSRTLALSLAGTPWVVFLDSDVLLRSPRFFAEACRLAQLPGVGAIVGMSVGHTFRYGLPFGLTMVPLAWARSVEIPPSVNARETYFFQQALRRDRRRVAYVPDAMEHRSMFRGHKPEWEGANTRLVAGWSLPQLGYALVVILLIHMNSRKPKNVLYTPLAYAKFLRGFLNPDRWRVLDRRTEPVLPG
ncbi:MAG: glycosyltransferase family 2 protein [Thermoplasmata archaeon]|nr:glycosyltransferase family 2 protein [Thermoplasmata archaeon]